jgi:hypothetical protein
MTRQRAVIAVTAPIFLFEKKHPGFSEKIKPDDYSDRKDNDILYH